MYYKSLRSRFFFIIIKKKNKIINQKFFYNEVRNYIGLKSKDVIEFDMSNRQKYNIDFYLYTKDLNIDYFRIFFGYLMVIKFEGYNKKKEYKEGICLYFCNNYLQVNKDFLIILKNKIDVNNILVL